GPLSEPTKPATDAKPPADIATPDTKPADSSQESATGQAHGMPTPDAQDAPDAGEPSLSDAEDQRDLARLDGAQADQVEQQAPSSESSPPAASGSLLDYADKEDKPADVADGSDEATAPEGQEIIATKAMAEDREAPAQAGSAKSPPADDDDMTADDLRDAEDNEDWTDEDATASGEEPIAAPGRSGGPDDAAGTFAKRPRLQVPPLKTEGFMPSAFSFGSENKTPDTSLLGKLPVPLIIHSGDQLHYANEEFLDLT
ncbi:PAS domain-containing sensor histidine kinase, partial [Mesorhizobium sp. M8A.F.Ca.ET.023.01.1.1]